MLKVSGCDSFGTNVLAFKTTCQKKVIPICFVFKHTGDFLTTLKLYFHMPKMLNLCAKISCTFNFRKHTVYIANECNFRQEVMLAGNGGTQEEPGVLFFLEIVIYNISPFLVYSYCIQTIVNVHLLEMFGSGAWLTAK